MRREDNSRGFFPAGGKWGSVALCATLCWSAMGSTGWAQGSRPSLTPNRPPATRVSYSPEQTRDIIDTLSNDFMNDFSRRRFPGSNDPFGNGNNGNTRPANTGTLTQQMRTLRPLMQEFSDDMSQLTYELNDEVRRVPTIRPMLTDAIKVASQAVGLNTLLSQVNDHQFVLNEVQNLDASWRELAYRLGNVRGLSRGTLDRVASLNQINNDIDNAIGIAPQLNSRDLYDKTNALAQDLRNLIDDVQAELGPREAQPFLLSLSRARQQILNIASMINQSNVDIEMIRNEYKRFQTMWYPERVKLQEYDSRYFERSLRRITQTDGEIHQLLLLPTKVDNQQLLYLTSALKKDIDEFFDRTSLKLLMHMPRADRVAVVASEFYGVCEHFIDEVNSNTKYDQLVDSFRYIEDAQRDFANVFYDMESDEALAALHQIEVTIQALSASLQVERDDFDRQRAVDLAANVETLTDQLDWAAQRWFSQDRQSFATACMQEIAKMKQQTARLNQDLVRGASLSQLRTESEQLYNTWRNVYNYLVKCQTSDRSNLGRLSSNITPALVELRTLLNH
ncbi:hypothetical protein GC163_06465 [bacterium]|nr:hypothetical protein [bacterium]